MRRQPKICESAATHAQMAELSAATQTQIMELRAELTTGLEKVKADLLRWSCLFWCAAVGSMAGLSGIFR